MPRESSPKSAEGAASWPREMREAEERAASLVSVFYGDPGGFGSIRGVVRDAVPEPARSLIDHNGHMTVTMEAFLGGPVNLQVLQESRRQSVTGDRYVREILLKAASGRPVQYGIVRLDLSAVPAEARRRIEAGSAPLGRILIEAGTFREVHDVRLIEVVTGPVLAERITVQQGVTLHGRVATISLTPHIDGGPLHRQPDAVKVSSDGNASLHPHSAKTAIELLEIPLVR